MNPHETPDPAPEPPRRPLTRGLGVVAGVASFGAMGLADGALALYRTPQGSLAPHLSVLVLVQCVMVLVSFGIALGLVEELALASVRRLEFMRRFARWAVGGPRRWFARAPDAAAAVLTVTVGVALALGPTFPVAYNVIIAFHSKPLAALAIFLTQVASLLVAAGAALALAAPVRALCRRLGPLASPGAVVAVALAAVALQSVRFIWLNWGAFHNLEFGLAALVGALLLGNLAALLLLGRRVARRDRALAPRSVLAAGGVALLAFVLSAFTFGARQTVAATIFNRSTVTARVARAFQTSIDLDRDGFSSLFNGGDCNDRDPGVNPRARDVPGNGRDENCSGRDARVEVEEAQERLEAPPAAFGAPQPSIVFLSVDAMRPDHMGSYGYRRPTTPNIDAFMRGGARFTHVWCASPRSLRSFSAIFVGRYASRVSWGADVQYPPLELGNHTLAEKLTEAGYLTAAVHGTSYFSHTAGFHQGFTVVQEEYGFKNEAGPTARRILEFLDQREASDQPFFLWSHLMEPHDPWRDLATPREFGHRPVDTYDEEVARADANLAPVLERLDAMSAKRPLFVFVFADHGEAFGEHGVWHHSFDLHDEALRVPLLVRGPGVAAGPRHALASLLDLHSTALHLARIPGAEPLSGRSLVPVLADPSPGRLLRPGWRDHLFAEVTPDGLYPSEQQALWAHPFKIIRDVRRGTWELFNVEGDPRELRNLYDDRPDVAAELRERLLTFADHTASAANRSGEVIQAARLRAPPTPQHPLNVRFGDIFELLGYDLPADRMRINDSYRAVFYYRVLRRTRVPVLMLVEFEPVDGQPIWPLFRAPHHPVEGRYPTTEWNPGEVLRDEVALRVDPEMRPVRLRAYFAAEIEGTRQRVVPLPQTGATRVELAPVEILP